MKVQKNNKPAVKRAGVRSAVRGAVGSHWRFARATDAAVWRLLFASAVRLGSVELQAASEAAAWQAKMCRARRMFKAAPAAPAAPATVAPATGAGVLAAAMAAAGVVCNPARRAMAAECQSIGQLLQGSERPAGPLLQAVQLASDVRMCRQFASRFNSKMVCDGRQSLWLHHVSGDGWAATMADAIADGIAALIRWRAGYGLVRDESGGDVLAVGDNLGDLCGAVVRRVILPNYQDETEAAAIGGYCAGRGLAVKYQTSTTAARLAWRSIVQSVSRDTLGESSAQKSFAADYYNWATGARDWRGLTVEQRRARRLATVDFRCEQLAAGRGQRAAFAAKAKHATVLMLSGSEGETAAAAAGFKSSPYQGGGGARSSLNRFSDSLRRAGLPVVSRRGNFAQSVEGDYVYSYRHLWRDVGGVISCLGFGRVAIETTSNRLGGAAKDLAQPFTMPRGVQVDQSGGVSFHPFEPRMFPPAAAASARVAGLHPLAKSVSGLGLPLSWRSMVASESVELSSLPALPAQLRRAVAAFNRRKFKGVLRPAPAPAAPAPAAGAGAGAAWLAYVSEGAAYVAKIAAAKELAAAAAAAVARRFGVGLSSSTELRLFKFCPLIKSGPLAAGQWFNYKTAWRDVGGVLSCVGLVRV